MSAKNRLENKRLRRDLREINKQRQEDKRAFQERVNYLFSAPQEIEDNLDAKELVSKEEVISQ